MRILGIESSCDETAIAVVEGREAERDGLSALSLKPLGLIVLTNLVASQAALHAKYGGVVPEVAAREHVDVIFPLLLESGIPRDGSGIDAIAVTAGPGLVPALRVGVELAKTLAWAWRKPLVAVNHLEGHLYSTAIETGNWKLETGSQFPISNFQFPIIALLVSGGHTEIVLMRGHGEYERVGATRDDAAGEAFDKVAKLLGLGYPGGPAVSKMAEAGDPSAIAFPRPMLESGDFDFSFSGLKTAVSVYLRACEPANLRPNDVCASFQAAVVDTLVTKTMRAVEKHQPKSVILSGGVAANKRLRASLAAALHRDFSPVASNGTKVPVNLLVPDLAFTGDNAAMIAAAGYFRAVKNDFTDPLTLVADPNMKLV